MDSQTGARRLFVAATLIAAFGFSADKATADQPSRELFRGILTVESNGNDSAVGDGGRSRGPYQISRAYWSDACAFGSVDWDYDKFVKSRWHCQRVMTWHWQKCGAVTDEQRARTHNGGPRGCSKKATLGYWRKVQAAMAKEEA